MVVGLENPVGVGEEENFLEERMGEGPSAEKEFWTCVGSALPLLA